MALTSFSELKSSLRNWAKRSSLDDATLKDFVSLTETMLNYGDEPNGLLPLRTRDMETTATVTMTSGVGDLPADFLEVIKVKDPGAVTRTIRYAAPDWLDESYPLGQDQTYPEFYTIIGDEIYCPIDVSLTYYAKIDTITGNEGATNWLLTKAPNAYLYGGLMHYSIYDKDAEKAAGYRALMVGALNAIGYSDMTSRAGQLVRRSSMTAY